MSPRRPQLGTLAAGAVCWRLVDGKPKALLVHRAYRDDVSLPKGKVDPGEALPTTAVREIEEETGLQVRLGPFLGVTQYRLPNRKLKRVHYWSAEVTAQALDASSFEPNGEIAELQWAGLKKAKRALSYPRDGALLDEFAAGLAAGHGDAFPVVLLRHAKALPRGAWDGPDATRPLLHRGLTDAAHIAPILDAWRIERLISSPAARCIATIGPYAAASGLAVEAVPGIAQDEFELGRGRPTQTIREVLAGGVGTVLCSHGPVLPELLAALIEQTGGVSPEALPKLTDLAVGEFLVLQVSPSAKRIVSVERYGPRSVF